MNNLKKLGAFSLLTATLGCAMLAGCTTEADGVALDDEASLSLDTTSMLALAGGSSLKLERAPGAADFAVVNAEGWQQIEPGIWEHEEAGIKQQLAVDEQGNRSLLARTEKDLEVLYGKRDADDRTISPMIAQQEEILGGLLATSKSLAAQPGTSATISCNFGMYTGPSSAVTSPAVAGAAALGQIVCSGGCATFTVTTQACCSGLCTPASAFTRSVCATPWTAGSIRAGAGFGAAAVNINPPNITQSSSSFVCN